MSQPSSPTSHSTRDSPSDRPRRRYFSSSAPTRCVTVRLKRLTLATAAWSIPLTLVRERAGRCAATRPPTRQNRRDRQVRTGDDVDEVRVADRIALRALVDGYAQGADRRRPDQVAAQFTPDGVLTICTDPDGEQVRAERRGRDEIAEAMTRPRAVPGDRPPRRPAAARRSTTTTPTSPPPRPTARPTTGVSATASTVDRVMSIRYQDRTSADPTAPGSSPTASCSPTGPRTARSGSA